jgi:hypothetical protein
MDRPCRFTILGLAEHVLFKTGRYRAIARWNFDQRQPFYVRNLPFAALPFGLMFARAGSLSCPDFRGQLWADLIGLPIFLVSLIPPPRTGGYRSDRSREEVSFGSMPVTQHRHGLDASPGRDAGAASPVGDALDVVAAVPSRASGASVPRPHEKEHDHDRADEPRIRPATT